MGARSALVGALLALFAAVAAGQRSASPAEIKQAGADVPRLVDVLELEPGMAVADVGAGFGAMTMVLARRLGPSSRVYATDIASAQLSVLRDMAAREHLDNVTVAEGSERGDINRSLFGAASWWPARSSTSSRSPGRSCRRASRRTAAATGSRRRLSWRK